MSEPAPPRRPGGQLAARPLHFIWLLDASGSMGAGGKMKALNDAIRGAIPEMQRVARDLPQAAVYVNAIRFGDRAAWLEQRLIPISDFHWRDLEAGGLTALGEALAMVADTLQPPLIPGRALPPVLLLVTDGLPTDDFQAGLARLLAQPWGARSLRLAVALGEDGASPEAQDWLRQFVSPGAPEPLRADDAAALASVLRWAAVVALKRAVAPPVRLGPAPISRGLHLEFTETAAAGGW